MSSRIVQAGQLRPSFEFCDEIGRDENAFRFGILETDSDPLDRRVAVERQPGGADLGDGDLRDQKIMAARHPEARDMAGTQSLAHEAPRDGLGLGVDLGVGQLAIARHHRDAVRIEGGGSGENLAQQFVADEIGPFGAAQDGFPAKERSRAVAVRGKASAIARCDISVPVIQSRRKLLWHGKAPQFHISIRRNARRRTKDASRAGRVPRAGSANAPNSDFERFA